MQNIERKSHKEMQFLNKLNFMFIFNSLICPLLNGIFLEYATKKGSYLCAHLVKNQKDFEQTVSIMGLVTVIDLQDFYTRLVIQMITLTIFDQLFLNFEKLTAIHKSIAKNQGKTKFEHWFHDLSFKSSLAITFFTVGLCLSLIYPHMSILILALFTFLYYMEKYNLMYRYPLEFESQKTSRMILVKNSFYTIILF